MIVKNTTCIDCGKNIKLNIDESIRFIYKFEEYYKWHCSNCGREYIVKIKDPVNITQKYYDKK